MEMGGLEGELVVGKGMVELLGVVKLANRGRTVEVGTKLARAGRVCDKGTIIMISLIGGASKG